MRIFIFIGFIVLNTLVGQAQTWFEYYRQGIDYAQADSLEKAKVLFEKTLKIQPHDRSQARIYGVNFIEYFPNREIGILLYRQQQYDQAIEYLEKSIAYEPSKRAEPYNNPFSLLKNVSFDILTFFKSFHLKTTPPIPIIVNVKMNPSRKRYVIIPGAIKE